MFTVIAFSPICGYKSCRTGARFGSYKESNNVEDFLIPLRIHLPQRIHHQPERQLCHILRRLIGIRSQPGLHKSDTAGQTEGIGVFQILNRFRKGLPQYVQAVNGDQIFNPV